MDDQKEQAVKVDFFHLFTYNMLYLKRKVYKPIFKILCMRLIRLYQKYLSRHTCLYRPTCSQYTMECINNLGVIPGILLGCWRILRCNPFSKGGYDPAPENPLLKRWVL